MKRTNQYHASVSPDGSWQVTHEHGYHYACHQYEVATGQASDHRLAEMAARCAIEDHKAKIAKQNVHASMVQSFTVKA